MAIPSSVLSKSVESIPVGDTADSDGTTEANDNVVTGRLRYSGWRRLDSENSSEYRILLLCFYDVGNQYSNVTCIATSDYGSMPARS